MNKPLVLVVEDDAAIRNLISTTLETHNYKHRTAGNGEMALMEAVSHNPEVVLLDLGLPDMDGVEIIKKIRSWSSMPIIVISARSEETDKIEALDAGADDYVTKPFYMGELMARIRVGLRKLGNIRTGGPEAIFVKDGLAVDYEKRKVTVGEEEVHLTPIEYKILLLLIANQGKVLTHNYIIREIWGYSGEIDAGNLRVFMATLRRKIEKDPANPGFILTEIGVGYRFCE